VDGKFLMFLLGGMACGVVTGVFLITHLLETFPQILWAFFFGLIISSAWYVGRQVNKWTAIRIASLVIGIVVAYVVTAISPVEGSTNLLYVAASGLLAICALMLPGLSGSFVLLLLGMYTIVIGSLKELLSGQISDNILLIGCFVVGMLLGLMTFSRVLTWMFSRYRMSTLALLAGFMIGSLPRIWPWRIPTRWLNDSGEMLTSGTPGEHARILSERMVWPGQYNIGEPYTLYACFAFGAGLAVIVIAVFIEERIKRNSAV
jgi:putative membrane protein